MTRQPARRRKAPARPRRKSASDEARFPIVGIGASAGGLEAFSELLKSLPLDTGMAFVLVQHLDPQHESALTHLLSRTTRLPVQDVTNKLRVQPNRVYVIPPNVMLTIAGGVLKLKARPKQRTPQRAIDFFLESLADDQRERAIGVILSGTASDGTLGLEAIKAEGGITFAQDDSARYDSMPKSAVAAGCVDFVLSPKQIARELARIARHPVIASAHRLTVPEDNRAFASAHEDDETALPSGGRGAPPTGARQARAEAERGKDSADQAIDQGYRKILLLLRNHSGVDFSLYKSSTIQRRVARRTVLQKQLTLDDYARFLRGNDKELGALYSDVLISVTSFFRNPEAFQVLETRIFPKMLAQRDDDPVRVWVLGCSTGQEAYSIAMAFVEAAEKAPKSRRLQVFATDLNDALLDKARHGLYAKTLAQDISAQRLRRFFVEEEGGYRIIKPLRDMVVFAKQNLIADPPFSRMDLISCRNLLIYLDASLQRKAMPTFHYALKAGGYLFLGASESIGGFTELFEPADKKQKIFARKPAPTPGLHLPMRKERGQDGGAREPAPAPQPKRQDDALAGFRGETNAQREADRVTVNQFSPPGVLVSADLQVLQFRGPTAAYLSPPAGKASFDVLKMARGGLMLPLRSAIARARRANKPARKENLVLQQNGRSRKVNLEVIPLKNLRERCFLILFEDAAPAAAGAARRSPGARDLPQEGGASREASRRVGELEAELTETRDYMQSVEEQHEAANEELQAANEEVQSANEELQSINEELETSKEELESANEELTTVNDEMTHRNAELHRVNSDLVNFQMATRLAVVLVGRDLTIRRFSTQAETQFGLLLADLGRRFGQIRHDLVDVPPAPEGESRPEAAAPARKGRDARKAPREARPAPVDIETLLSDVIARVREHEREVRDSHGRWFSLRIRPYFTLDNKVDGAVLVLVDIDEQKRNEQAALVERDYAEGIVRTTRDPLLVLDADLRVHTANDAFHTAFGSVAADSAGRLLYELGDGQWDIPALRRLLEEILSRNSFFNDFEVTHDFGPPLGRRTMLLNARSLMGAGGEPNRILLGIQDISETLQYQLAERESAEKFKLLFDRSPLPKWAIDLATLRFTEVNAALLEHYGYNRNEFLRMTLLDLLAPESAAALSEMLARAPHRLPESARWRQRKKSGELIEVEVRGSEIAPAGRRIWLATVIDVTERERVAAAIRASEAAFRELADAMPHIVWAARPDGYVDYYNRRWYEYTGFGEVFGEASWQPIVHPDDLARVLAAYREGMASGEACVVEHRFRDRWRGGYRWFLGRAMPVRNEGGQIVRWYGTFTDIDELKEADRRKDEFLAMLAHELRGPLAPLTHMLEIVKRSADGGSGEIGQAGAVMARQLGQLIRIIDDLLDVSRISRGKLALRRAEVELSSVVYQAVEAARPLLDAARQELTLTLPQQAIWLDADATRLAQVIGNLLSNASKFSEPGGAISLSVEQRGGDVSLAVRDQGIGIPPEMLPRAFEMFSQLDSSLERTRSGLGIGLALVQQLVEMHGGSVRGYSEGPGKGSEFVVRLPVHIGAARSAPAAGGEQEATISGRRILVADDNKDSADSLAALLEMSGNETRTAHDGLAAVAAAASFRPEIALLDIGMPKLNGYDVARRIRAEPWGQSIVLLALTGWGQDEDRRKSREAGFNGHLVKPVDFPALAKLLAGLPPQREGTDTESVDGG